MLPTKIGTKLVLVGLFLVIMPVLLVGFLAVNQSSQGLSALAEQSLLTISKNLSTSIDSNLTYELRLVESLAFIDNIIQLVETQASGGAISINELELVTSEISQIKSIAGEHYSSILIVGIDSKTLASSDFGKLAGLDLTGRKYLKKAFAGTPNIGNVVISRASGKPVCTAAAPIRSPRTHKIIGAVVSAIYVDYVANLASEVKVQESGYSYVVDQRGLYITHPRKENILKLNITEEPGLGPVAAFLQDSKEGIAEYQLKGVTKVAAISQARGIGWQIVTAVPKSELLAPANALKHLILGIGASFLLVTGGVFFLFARSLTGPINELQEGAEIIGTGDLEHQIHSGFKGEFATLARAFNEMSAKLKTSRQQLETEIVERKQAEVLIQEINAELKRSNEELEQFAFAASHDMQEPLRKITAFGERLKQHCQETLDEKGTDYLDRMSSAASRMALLIDGLLDYARVSTKGKPFSEISLASEVAEVLNDLEYRIQAEEGEIIIGELPTISGDHLQIRQLFQNLLGNALKFHPRSEPPRIRVSSRELGTGFVEISVEDSGIGIDPQYAERIFKPFQRLHGRDEFEGTGMGLAICHRIVKRHGGSIILRGNPDHGSTFVITLPLLSGEKI